MNSKHTYKFKALLSLVLSISMLFSMVVTSFAALPGFVESDGSIVVDKDSGIQYKNTIKYVSLGDSVTNGYVLNGYFYEVTENGQIKWELNPRGMFREVDTAYPSLIKEYLAKETGSAVELTQLAASGMRYGDLRVILDENFAGDYYLSHGSLGWLDTCVERWLGVEYYENNAATLSKYDITTAPYEDSDDRWSDYWKDYSDGDYYRPQDEFEYDVSNSKSWTILNSEYTKAIKEADFISIDLGTNDFGTFLTHRLSSLMGMEGDTAENFIAANPIDYSVYMDDISAQSLKILIEEKVREMFSGDDFKETIIPDLANTLVYGLVAFCTNFDAVMEKIYELNPDVQVMIIDVYNMMGGMEMIGDVFGDIDVAVIYDAFIDISNLYTRSLSPWASRTVHVDLGKVGSEDYPFLFTEYFKDFDGWDNFENKYYQSIYNELIASGLDESTADSKAKTDSKNYRNEAQEGVDRFIRDVGLNARDDYGKWNEAKKGLDMLNGIVNDLAGQGGQIDQQVFSQVVDTVKSSVDDGLNGAFGLTGAGAGYNYLIETQIPEVLGYVEYIDKAVNGYKQAKQLLDVIVNFKVEAYENKNLPDVIVEFKNSSKLISMIAGALDESIVNDVFTTEDGNSYDLKEYGLSEAVLPEHIKSICLIYKEESSFEGETGEVGAIKAIIDMVLKAQPMSIEINSHIVYNMATSYLSAQDKLTAIGNAMYVFLMSQNVEQSQAQKQAQLGALIAVTYETAYDETGSVEYSNDAVVIALLTANLTSEEVSETDASAMAQMSYDIYKNGSKATREHMIAALSMPQTGFDESVAVAIYDCYDTHTKELVFDDDLNLAGEISEYRIYDVKGDGSYTLNGAYSHPTVITAMQTLMGKIGQDASQYDLFKMYREVPYTFSKVLQHTTIDLGVLLGAANVDENGNASLDIESIIYDFKAGKLNLDLPVKSDYDSEEEWKTAYDAADPKAKYDVTLMLMYIRHLAVDGLFTHPGTEGHATFTRLIKEQLADFVPNTVADAEYRLDYDGITVVSIGDTLATGISGDKTNEAKTYGQILAEAVGGETTLIEYGLDGARVNDIYSFINGYGAYDAYTNVIRGANNDYDFTEIGKVFESINSNDIVLLNVGAMNAGFALPLVAAALGIEEFADYKTALEDLNFANMSYENGILNVSKDVNGENSIGERMNEIFGDVDASDAESEMGLMKLIMKAYLYGYIAFADNIDELIDSMSAKVGSTGKVVLVGLNQLIPDGSIWKYPLTDGNGDPIYAKDSEIPLAQFDLTAFFNKTVSDINGHMKTYAGKYSNVYYLDSEDEALKEKLGDSPINSVGKSEAIVIAGSSVDALAASVQDVLPNACFTEAGHRAIAEYIACDILRIHFQGDDEQSNNASDECGAKGTLAGTCTKCGESYVRTLEAIPHEFGGVWDSNSDTTDIEAAFEWGIDENTGKPYAALLCVCGRNNCSETDKVVTFEEYTDFDLELVDSNVTCTTDGYEFYKAEVSVDGVLFSGQNSEEEFPTEAYGHDYTDSHKNITWIWADDYSAATAVFTCTKCNGNEPDATIEVPASSITVVTTNATCYSEGSNVYNAVVETKIDKNSPTNGKYYDSEEEIIAKIAHTYGEPTWTWSDDHSEAVATFECTVDGCVAGIEGNDDRIVEVVNSGIVPENTATCTAPGKLIYTAVVELNDKEYVNVYEEESLALGHDIVDGVCERCEVVFEGDCEVLTPAELSSGKTLVMKVGGVKIGNFTFTKIGDGWTIKAEDGTYVAYEDGLVYSKTAYVWDFADGKFSTEVSSLVDSVIGSMIGITIKPKVWYIAVDNGELTATKKDGNTVEFFTSELFKEHKFEEVTTVEPTCTEDGYTILACQQCGVEIRETGEPAKGHNFVDGKCECGEESSDEGSTGVTPGGTPEQDPDNPNDEPEVPIRPDETGDCVYVTEEELDSDGVYTLILGGEKLGEFEFVAVDGGWTISDENGDYLAVSNGELVYGSEKFVWTFENGMFSAEETIVKEVVTGSFWGGLFGDGNDEPEIITTKYYLAVIGEELILSDVGDEAEFEIEHHDDKHSYDEGVVTKPTCEDKGFTTYTCEKCGEECIYNEKEKLEHNYVDGECEFCGKPEDSDEPDEPDEPEDTECIYMKEVELEKDGTYFLTIGDDELGEFTITKVEDGWTILDESDDTYLAFINGMLVYTDVEFVWSYEDGKFFYEEVKVATGGGFWGGLFGGSNTTTTETVYYIVVEDSKVLVSEDDADAEVLFEIFVVDKHEYVDGVCENCGKHKESESDDECVYLEAVELTEDGKYVLVLNGEEIDTFTFENVEDDLWTIMNEDGEYVALEAGEIVYTDAEFEWIYDTKSSSFSAEIVKVTTGGGFWGGLFGSNSTTVTTYYLVADDGELEVSTNKKTATAEFFAEVVDIHAYGAAESYNGFDVYTCKNCGKELVVVGK